MDDDDDIVCLSPEPRQVFEGAKESHRPSAGRGRGRGRGDAFRYWRRDEEQNNYNRPQRYFDRRSPSPGRQRRSSSYGRYHDQGNHHHEGPNDQDPYSKRPRTSPGHECGAYYEEGVETRAEATSYYNRPRIQNNHLHCRPSVDSRPYDMSFQRPGTAFSGSTSSENDALPTIENGPMVRNPLFKPQSLQTKPSGYSEPIMKIRRRRKSPSMLEPLYNTSSLPLHPPQSSFSSASSSNNVLSDSSDLAAEDISPTIRPTSSPEVIELEGSDDEIQMILEESVSSCDRGPAPNKTASTQVPKTTTDNQTSQSVGEIRDQHVQTDLQKQSKQIERSRQIVSKVSIAVQTDETEISSSSSSESSSSDDDDDSSSSDDVSTAESEGECEIVKDKLLGAELKDQRANGIGVYVQYSQNKSVEEVEEDDVVILEERLLPTDASVAPVMRDGEATVKTETCDLHENDTNTIPSVVEKEIVSEVLPKCVQVETKDTQESIDSAMEMEVSNQPETVVRILTEKPEAKADGTEPTEKSEAKADGTEPTEKSEAKADGVDQTEVYEAKADGMEQTEESVAKVDGMGETEESEAKADGMEQTEESEAKADGMDPTEMSNKIESNMENEETQKTKSVDVETEKADRTESASMETGKLPQTESSTMELEEETNPEAISLETVKIEAPEAATIGEENPAITPDRNSSKMFRKTNVLNRESNTSVETSSLNSSSSVSSEAGPSAKKCRLSYSAPANVLKNPVTATSGDEHEQRLVLRKLVTLKAQVVEGPTGFQFVFDPSLRELVAIPDVASQINRLENTRLPVLVAEEPGLLDGAEVDVNLVVSQFKKRGPTSTGEPSRRCSASTEASDKDCEQSVETESPLVQPSPTQKPYDCVQISCDRPSSSESGSMNTPATVGATDKETDENIGSDKTQVTPENEENAAVVKVENVTNAEDFSSTHVDEPALTKTDDSLGITPDSCDDTLSSLTTNNLTDKKLPPLQNFSAGLSPVNFEPSGTQVFAGSYKKIREALLKKKTKQP